jgi:hypothetical protein
MFLLEINAFRGIRLPHSATVVTELFRCLRLVWIRAGAAAGAGRCGKLTVTVGGLGLLDNLW